jgi:hypothetical protein
MSSVRRVLHTATFRFLYHTEQPPGAWLEEKCAKLTPLYATRIVLYSLLLPPLPGLGLLAGLCGDKEA